MASRDLDLAGIAGLFEIHHPGLFAERRLGHHNAPFHWEWYQLQLQHSRLCVVAPRAFGKSNGSSRCFARIRRKRSGAGAW